MDFSFVSAHSASLMSIWPLLKKNVYEFIHLAKKKKGGGHCPLHTPSGLRPWTPDALGLRTLASLVSVWIKFAKTSPNFFCIHFFFSNEFFFQHLSENYTSFPQFYVVRLLFFEIRSILYSVSQMNISNERFEPLIKVLYVRKNK